MGVRLDHTIVHTPDPVGSAAFFAEVFGRPEPVRFGPFLVVEVDNGVSLDFHEAEGEVPSMHYAFLVGEPDFDEIFGRVQARGVPYYADPGGRLAQQINTHDDGRGVYFAGPEGHWYEIITVPYGGWRS